MKESAILEREEALGKSDLLLKRKHEQFDKERAEFQSRVDNKIGEFEKSKQEYINKSKALDIEIKRYERLNKEASVLCDKLKVDEELLKEAIEEARKSKEEQDRLCTKYQLLINSLKEDFDKLRKKKEDFEKQKSRGGKK